MIAEPQSQTRPLCVDLDGTLIKTDTFAQALLLLVRTRPSALFSIFKWAPRGLAFLKQQVAREIMLDPDVLPVHDGFVQFLHTESTLGRKLVLATASDQSVAQRIADRFGFFSEVLGSNGHVNLKANRKRAALVERFGEGGFDYAGNASDDLEVWKSAVGIIAVNPCKPVRRALVGTSARIFDDRPPLWKAWMKAVRVQQWLKNSLIFLPMLLAHELSRPSLYAQAFGAFLSFSFLASAIYVVNDLLDLHADQHHPRKRRRQFAEGNLTLLAGAVAVPLLIAASLLIARFLPIAFSGILLFYLLLTTFYSWRLKQLVVVDVLALACFYTIRILAGTAAYSVITSSWLIAFSLAIFGSLALVKRYAELREAVYTQPDRIGKRGRGYQKKHLPFLAGAGTLFALLSVVVLGLYINSAKVMKFYHTPHLLWLLCPLVLYWIGRIWHLAMRGKLSDDPLEFAARDSQTLILGLLGILILVWGAV